MTGGVEQTKKQENKPKAKRERKNLSLKKPRIPQRKIVEKKLKESIIGQDEFIKKILVAIYRHMKFDVPTRILVVGPTGSGKTETLVQIAKLLNIPYTLEDATMYTQEGYIGHSIEEIVENLIANAKSWNMEKKIPWGLIIIDEIDKKASRVEIDKNDVAGKPVQQGLLKMMDGIKIPIYGMADNEQDQENHNEEYNFQEQTMRQIEEEMRKVKEDVEEHIENKEKNPKIIYLDIGDDEEEIPFEFDTSKSIFICMGAFEGLDKIRQKRTKDTSIGFLQNGRTKDTIKEYTEKDFLDYGMIREFIGRFDCIAETKTLTVEDYVQIIKNSKLSAFKANEKILRKRHISLKYSEELIMRIAKKAHVLKIGARGIKSVVNYIFENILCEIIDAKKNQFSECVLLDEIIDDNTKYTIK